MAHEDLSGAGLSSAEAAERLRLYGPNEPTPPESHHRWAVLAAFVSNPLVLVLLAAAGVSFSLGDRINALIIVLLVIVSVALDAIQNFRSHSAMQRLQGTVAPTATVRRNGEWAVLRRDQVVPGDVVKLGAGDLVPADGRLVDERDLHVQEAALTGESLPVEKGLGTGTDEERVFQGTSVVSGTGVFVVEATGQQTRFGDIANRLKSRVPETEFERGLHRFGTLITRLVIFLVLLTFMVLLAVGRAPLQSFLFAVALAVGLTPEFLPMITTLTLSKGAARMARHHVIVRNLASIQNFGSMDILCSDKTGTLTSGEMRLESSSSPETLELARVNARCASGVTNPLDLAILADQPDDLLSDAKVDEIPFDFERRRVSVVVDGGRGRTLICKGAPEGVFAACADVPEEFHARVDAFGRNGFRVLAVATKLVETKSAYGPEDETGLSLTGLLAFADPPLPDALDLIHRLAGAGVKMKVITGDSEIVSRHVCASIGMEAGQILLGEDVERMSDLALQVAAEQTTVFARVNPAQKNRIILALRACGHVVGYMGDGINDAPSLHAADVGISFAGATAVAKDAAQIVLLERGLGVVHKGVLEGRMAFGNVMKYLLMGTSSNFGNMFSMAGAAAFLPFLPMLPTQILLNNLMYDAAQITIPTDLVDPSFMRKPRRWDMRLIRNFMLTIGPISSIFDFITFYVLLKVFHAGEAMFHSGWFVESLATQTLVIFVIRTRRPAWRSMPSKALAVTTVGMCLIGIALPYTPLAVPLGFVALPTGYLAFVVVATLAYLAIVELVKTRLVPAETTAA